MSSIRASRSRTRTAAVSDVDAMDIDGIVERKENTTDVIDLSEDSPTPLAPNTGSLSPEELLDDQDDRSDDSDYEGSEQSEDSESEGEEADEHSDAEDAEDTVDQSALQDVDDEIMLVRHTVGTRDVPVRTAKLGVSYAEQRPVSRNGTAKASRKVSYFDMVIQAISNIKDRQGASRPAIKQYLYDTFELDDISSSHFKAALNSAVECGMVLHTSPQRYSINKELSHEQMDEVKKRKTTGGIKPKSKSGATDDLDFVCPVAISAEAVLVSRLQDPIAAELCAKADAATGSDANIIQAALLQYYEKHGPLFLQEFVLNLVLQQSQITISIIADRLKLTPIHATFIRWATEPRGKGRSAATSIPLEDAATVLISNRAINEFHGAYTGTPVGIQLQNSNEFKRDRALNRQQGSGGFGLKQQQQDNAALRARRETYDTKQTTFFSHHMGLIRPFMTDATYEKFKRSTQTTPTQTTPTGRSRRIVQSTYANPSATAQTPASDTAACPCEFQLENYPILSQPTTIVNGEMRDYQLKGFSFMAHMHNHGMHPILADEMGLGKTVQTIAFIAWLRQHYNMKGPYLVVAPLNVLDTWMSEIKRWCPSLSAVRFHGPETERKRIADNYMVHGKCDIIVTSYEVLVAEMHLLQRRYYFNYIIADEAHKIKSTTTLVSQALRGLSSFGKVLLTGTPMQNNLTELWALLFYLYPNVFSSSEPFDKGFNLTANVIDSDLLLRAQEMMKPLMIRRLKTVVAATLPPKTEIKIYCQLSPYQQHWYKRLLSFHANLLDNMAQQMSSTHHEADVIAVEKKDNSEDQELVISEADAIAKLESGENGDKKRSNRQKKEDTEPADEELQIVGGDDSSGAGTSDWRRLLNLMMQLRKCCNHPYVFPGGEPENATLQNMIEHSGKLMLLDRLLVKLQKEQHRVLIFSGFTSMLTILEDFCLYRGYKYLRLDGGTSRVERKFEINRFNTDPSIFIYLISTRAGGLGVSLPAADTVVHYDSDYNPQVDLQAQDRCHRLTQTKPVTCYRLITEGTVEERVVARAAKKLYLDAMVTMGRNSFGAEKERDQMSRLTKRELLSMIKFGADRVFKTSNNALSDADLDAIIDQSRAAANGDAATTSVSSTTVSSATSSNTTSAASSPAPSPVPSDIKFYDETTTAENFDINIKELSLHAFGGTEYNKVNNYKSIADDWVNLSRERKRTSTTTMVGRDAVLNVNNYSMESDMGRPIEARDYGRILHVKYKRFSEHLEYCHGCKDGGTIMLCANCPRSYHFPCAGYNSEPNMFSCPHHRCQVCSRNAADAGGVLFVCLNCPSSYCDEHLPMNFMSHDSCRELDELGYKGKWYYITCTKECEEEYQQAEEEHLKQLTGSSKGAVDPLANYHALDPYLQKHIKHILRENLRERIPLNHIDGIAERVLVLHTESEMLHKLHEVLYEHWCHPRSIIHHRILGWQGITVPHPQREPAALLFKRIMAELRLWASNSIYDLVKLLGISIQADPYMITKGKAAGRYVTVEPRLLSSSDPMERVHEAIACFLIGPSHRTQLLSAGFFAAERKASDLVAPAPKAQPQQPKAPEQVTAPQQSPSKPVTATEVKDEQKSPVKKSPAKLRAQTPKKPQPVSSLGSLAAPAPSPSPSQAASSKKRAASPAKSPTAKPSATKQQKRSVKVEDIIAIE